MLPFAATPMSVPTVSNRSTNRNANTITANSTVLFSMKLKSNLNAVSPSAAKLGRNEPEGSSEYTPASGFTAYQPVNCAMMPSPHVMRMPQRMAPLTLKYSIRPMMITPMSASATCGWAMSPRATFVEASAAAMPAFCRPMNVMNRPMPVVMPYFRFSGMQLTSVSRNLNAERMMKIMPSTRMAVRAICQGLAWSASSPRQMV